MADWSTDAGGILDCHDDHVGRCAMNPLLNVRLQLRNSGPLDVSLQAGQHGTVVADGDSGKTAAALHIATAQPSKRPSDPVASIEGPAPEGISYVPSDPSLLFSLLGSTVREEVALSSVFVGRHVSFRRVDELLDSLGVSHLAQRDPFTLSGGESVRCALAIALMKEPSLLILDDIWDGVDRASQPELLEALATWRARTGAAILEFRRQEPSHGLVWRGSAETSQATDDCLITLTPCDAFVRIENLRSAYPSSGFSFGPLTETLRPRECIVLRGSNGSGKTTCLRTISGILRPEGGSVICGDNTLVPSTPLHLRARVAQYVFQNPDHQLYSKNIKAEITAAAVYAGRNRDADCALVSRALGLDDRMFGNPFEQPRAVRRLITIASALVSGAPLLLFDEPSACLDSAQKHRVISAIRAHCDRGGAAIIVSHDEDFVTPLSSTNWFIERGRVVAAKPS
jgi:energy-coupling factor transporter ATP-binding protein EcfA2